MLLVPLLAVMVQTLAGAPVDALKVPSNAKALVFIFTSTECPISNRYAPEIRRIVDAYGSKGVVFRLVYPDPADDASRIREHMTAFGYGGAFEALRDPEHRLVAFTRATVTPEVAVYANGSVVYHGRIDDRFVDLGTERPAPTVHDLADALAAVLAGRPVAHASMQPVGCYIADFKR